MLYKNHEHNVISLCFNLFAISKSADKCCQSESTFLIIKNSKNTKNVEVFISFNRLGTDLS